VEDNSGTTMNVYGGVEVQSHSFLIIIIIIIIVILYLSWS